jgi:hypothetical protein
MLSSQPSFLLSLIQAQTYMVLWHPFQPFLTPSQFSFIGISPNKFIVAYSYVGICFLEDLSEHTILRIEGPCRIAMEQRLLCDIHFFFYMGIFVVDKQSFPIICY